jgi:hypothetical protein
MTSLEFQNAKAKFNLRVGDRVKVKYSDNTEIYFSFKLLDCKAMDGDLDDYINIDEIENQLDWMEPGYWHLGHIEKIICKL